MSKTFNLALKITMEIYRDMENIFHFFIQTNTQELESYFNKTLSYKDFLNRNYKLPIYDDILRIMAKYRLLAKPCYNYNNTEITIGIDLYGASVIHPDQIREFISSFRIFECKIKNGELLSDLETFEIPLYKAESETEKYINFLEIALDKQLYIFHSGI